MNKLDYVCMNYSEEPNKCNGKTLKDIGPVGQTVMQSDGEGNSYGGTLHLYQCEDCREVKLLFPK